MVVVFPEPLGPSNPKISPSRKLKEMSSTARTPLRYCFVRWETLTTVSLPIVFLLSSSSEFLDGKNQQDSSESNNYNGDDTPD